MGPDLDKLIQTGKFGRPHGVRGDVRLWPASADSTSVFEVERLFVKRDGEVVELGLRNRRRSGRCVVVGLEGVGSREAAEALTGVEVWIDRTDLPDLDGVDEFYLHQLLGLQVSTVAGDALGTVTDVVETGASDVLVVGNEAGEEVMIPFVAVMAEVDLAAGRLVVDPPEGLLDATRTAPADAKPRDGQ